MPFGNAMKRPSKKTTTSARDLQRNVASHDGAILFVLKRTGAGLHMERTHVCKPNMRVQHAMMFKTLEAFECFYIADEARYQYPLIYQQIKRECYELFDAQL